MRVLVRRINEWDAPTMLKVYAPYVESSNSTGETVLPTIAEFVERIDKYTYGFGWIMAEIDGETAGFCLLTENRYEPKNMFTAEIQLFVKEKFIRRGVGSSLYSLMLDIMSYGNKRMVFARIPLPNDSGVAFHKYWGFEEFEIRKNDLQKNGRSYDVLVMKKELEPMEPEAIKPTKPFLIESQDYEAARIKAGTLIKCLCAD